MAFDPAPFDWKNPDYTAIFLKRMERLAVIQAEAKKDPLYMTRLKAYYRDHVADFINDWGMTFDPRNLEKNLPAWLPFQLFPRQREYVDWLIERWRAGEPGVAAKSRDVGLSWLTVSAACTLCMFHDGFVFNFGSRKEEYVDKLDGPKSLFFKARKFMEKVPGCFRGSWDAKKHAPYMKLVFPDTGSYINGEAGDNIGRGDRATIYCVDEEAFLERPQLVEASLSATTNCRISISTPNGMENPFYNKWMNYPEHQRFEFHWRDDPRKDDDWYAATVAKIDNPVIVAQELDLNFSASVEGVIIPSEWVQAAVDAHIKLGIAPSGKRSGGLDVADEGKDKNALAGGYGVLLDFLEEWSGAGSDIYDTTVKAFDICDGQGYDMFKYDADGLGAGVRGDARIINEERRKEGRKFVNVAPFHGSGAVLNPEKEDVEKRKNKDYFANRKAQEWFRLRKAFQVTFRAVRALQPGAEPYKYDPDDIIALDKAAIGAKLFTRLTQELSQPTYKLGPTGKIIVNKAPDGMRSPNLADAVMIWYARQTRAPLKVPQSAVRESAR